MNVKINLSTPPDQMWETMQDEGVKAIRWYNKHITKAGGEDKLKEAAERKLLDTEGHPSQLIFSQEWCSSTKDDVLNRWLCLEAIHYLNTTVHATVQLAALYYETSSSIGFFTSCHNDTSKKDAGGTPVPDNYIFCFTSHFFLRYCDGERKLGTMHDDKRQVIVNFLLRNHYGVMSKCMNQYKQNGQELVDICLSGCVGRGKVRRGDNAVVYEFDTCLSWPMLHHAQYWDLKIVLDAYKQHVHGIIVDADEMGGKADVSKGYLLEGLEREYIKGSYERTSVYNTEKAWLVTERLRDYLDWLISEIPLSERQGKDTYDFLHDVRFYVDQAWQLYRKMKSKHTLDEVNLFISDILVKCVWHYNIPLEEDYVRAWYFSIEEPINNNNNNQTVQTMNKLQIQELKRVLKENGVKNFSTLPQSFSLNSERYLELAEPIYVISRLLPYVNSDNDRQKMMKAQKAWMNIVIEKQWCSALDTYTEKHGKTLTQMAIEYCIDNDLWDSPKGNSALRTHTSDHFKGLEAINEAVEFLKGEGLTDEHKEEEQAPASTAGQQEYNAEVLDMPAASLVEFVDEAEKPNGYQDIIDRTASTPFDDVYPAEVVPGAFEHMKELLAKSLLITRNLEQYVNACVNPTDVLTENTRLSARVRSLEAQLDVKKDEVKAAKDEAQKAKDERNEVQQNYTKKSQEYDRIVKVKREQSELIKQQGEQIASLKKELEKGQKAFTALQEQAKSSNALPKRKVFKESELRKLPLMGDKMISILETFFEKNNCIIDHTK